MLAILLIATALPPADEEVAFFSDDVTNQSEKEMCESLCTKDECALLKYLTPASRRLYNSLDKKGKLRAIELGCICKNKNCAVRIAAEEMAKRQNQEYPFQKDYQEQTEERAQLKPYNRRFGY